MQPKLIIFDCDGTLVDSQHMIVSAMKSAYRCENIEPPEPDAIRAIIGLSLQQAVAKLSPDLERLAVDAIVAAYKTCFFKLRTGPDHYEPLFEGARQALEQLHRQDHMLLGIATGKARRGLDAVLARENLEHYFVTLQTADDAPSKPHPGMIDEAMAQTGIAQKDVVMIGDTSYDMQMGRNAGVTSIGVDWGYHPTDHLLGAGAHHIVEDFSELLTYLRQWATG